jgi:hypothetical protein
MNDFQVGFYTSPMLLMQEETTTKVLLDPITRAALGSGHGEEHYGPGGEEGVVDLYLMPGFDDIASFRHYENRWHIHYLTAEQKASDTTRKYVSKPLTKQSLKKILEELKANAQ